jgi:hypothetical protein
LELLGTENRKVPQVALFHIFSYCFSVEILLKSMSMDVNRGIYVTVLMVAGGLADLPSIYHRFTICQYLPCRGCPYSGRSQSAGCGAAEQIRSLHRIHRLVDPEPQAVARAARDRARHGGKATVVLVGV